MYKEDIQALGITVLIAAVIFGPLIWLGVKQTTTSRECLRLGYPQATWGPIAGAYCIAREDQSDIVRTLDDARRNPRRF